MKKAAQTRREAHMEGTEQPAWCQLHEWAATGVDLSDPVQLPQLMLPGAEISYHLHWAYIRQNNGNMSLS